MKHVHKHPPEPSTKITCSLRMPLELRAKLEQAAIAGDRNLSQEVVRRLRESFEDKAGAASRQVDTSRGQTRVG